MSRFHLESCFFKDTDRLENGDGKHRAAAAVTSKWWFKSMLYRRCNDDWEGALTLELFCEEERTKLSSNKWQSMTAVENEYKSREELPCD